MLSEFQPVSLLVALWPTQEFEFPTESQNLGEQLRAQFPLFAAQQNLTAPEGGTLPPELPRLILFGEQQQWVLELAPARMNLRRSVQQPPSLRELFDQVTGLLRPLHAWMAEQHNFCPYRIGCVVQLFCNTRSSANEKIAEYFLHQRALHNHAPHEVNLNLLTRLPINGGQLVNRWFRIKALRTNDPRHVDFAAHIEIDVNTLPENTQTKTTRDVEQYLAAVQHHIEFDMPFLNDPDFFV